VKRAWAGSALLAVLAATVGFASAQPAPAGEAGAARLITLAVATDTDEDVTQIVSYLRPVLEMRGLFLAVRRVNSLDDAAQSLRSGAPPGVRARIGLDLKTPGRAQVLLASGNLRPGNGRVVPTAAHIDQVAAAEIGEIILAGLLAPEAELETPAPAGEHLAGVSTASDAATWQRSLGVLAATQAWADGAAVIPEVGLSGLLEWQSASGTWRRAIWSTLRYRPPFQPAQDALYLRVRGGEAEVLGVIARGLGRRGSLGLAAGLGLDARLVDATPPAGSALANPQSVRELAPFLRTAVRFDFRLEGPLTLFAALTLDLFPLQGRLLVKQERRDRAVFTPWPLRPGALAGAAFAF
jgi:hypothetical protein